MPLRGVKMTEAERLAHCGKRGSQLYPFTGIRKWYEKRKGVIVKPINEKPCRECGQLFFPDFIQSKFCNYKCRNLFHIKEAKERYGKIKIEKIKEEKEVRKETKHYWRCLECQRKRELNFNPLKEYQKLRDIICECGYKNV